MGLIELLLALLAGGSSLEARNCAGEGGVYGITVKADDSSGSREAMSLWSGRLAAALLLALPSEGCSSVPAARAPAPRDAFEAARLATVPENVSVIVPPAFSRDGRHAVYVGRAEGKDRIVRDGAAGPGREFV